MLKSKYGFIIVVVLMIFSFSFGIIASYVYRSLNDMSGLFCGSTKVSGDEAKNILSNYKAIRNPFHGFAVNFKDFRDIEYFYVPKDTPEEALTCNLSKNENINPWKKPTYFKTTRIMGEQIYAVRCQK